MLFQIDTQKSVKRFSSQLLIVSSRCDNIQFTKCEKSSVTPKLYFSLIKYIFIYIHIFRFGIKPSPSLHIISIRNNCINYSTITYRKAEISRFLHHTFHGLKLLK